MGVDLTTGTGWPMGGPWVPAHPRPESVSLDRDPTCADVRILFSSRRRHTSLQGDWSSDVCSSDLVGGPPGIRGWSPATAGPCRRKTLDRKSVVYGKSVDLGGRRIIKKNGRADT